MTTATSFAAVGLEVDEDALLADYLRAVDEQLAALAAAGGDAAAAGVLGEIEALCTTIGAEVRVSLPDGTLLEGHAQRIDPSGRLVVIVGCRGDRRRRRRRRPRALTPPRSSVRAREPPGCETPHKPPRVPGIAPGSAESERI